MALTVGELVAFLSLDKSDYDRGRRSAERDAHKTGREIGKSLNVKVDRTGIEQFARRIRDLRTVAGAVGGPLKSMTIGLAGLATKAGAAASAVGAGLGLAGQALTLVSSLSALAGVAPVAIGALAGVAAAAAAVKIGMSGVSDALDKKIGKAFERISPNAQAFVDRFGEVVPMLVKARNVIQDGLFKGMADQVKPLAQRYLPMLTERGRQFATVFGRTARQAIREAMDPTTVAQFNGLLGAGVGVADKFREAFRGFVPVLGDVAEAVTPIFKTLGTEAAGALDDMKKKLQIAVADGSLKQFLQDGIQAAKDLFGIFRNVMGIMREVQGAFQSAFGKTTLGLIRDVTGQIRQFLGSAKGQATLVGILKPFAPVFREIGVTVRALLPEIQKLAPVVAGLALAFLQNLRPVLPVVGQLLRQIGGILKAILPDVSAAAVAFGTALGSALTALAPVLPILTQALSGIAVQLAGAFSYAIQTLAPILPQLAMSMAQFASAVGTALADALVEIAPMLPEIVKSFSDFLVTLTPLLPQLVPLTIELVKLAEQALPWIVAAMPSVVEAIGSLTSVMTGLIGIINSVIGTLRGAEGAMGAFYHSPLQVVGAINTLSAAFRGLMAVGQSVMTYWTTTIRTKMNEAKAVFGAFPGAVKAALGGLPGLMHGVGTDMMRGMINGIKGMAGQVASSAREVVSGAVDAAKKALHIGSPSKVMHQIGGWTIQGYINGIKAQFPAVRKLFTQLAALATSEQRGQKLEGGRRAALASLAVEARATQRLATLRERTADRIKAATKKLGDAEKAFRDYRTKVAGNITGTGDVGRLQVSSAANLITALEQRVRAAQAFGTNLATLRRRGLNGAAIRQLTDAGVEQGGANAGLLAHASAAEIKRVNALQTTLNRAGANIGQSAARQFYGAGVAAAKGLVNGLKSQASVIARQMAALARTMTREIKRALGIRSPSTVMRDEVGKMAGRGLAAGLAQSGPSVADAARRLARSAVVTPAALALQADRQARATLTRPGGAAGGMGAVRVYIGDRELTDIVKVEVRDHTGKAVNTALAGAGRRGR